jgi:hypothetical protein
MNRIIVGVFVAFLSQMALAGPIGFSKAKSLAESFFYSDEAVGISSRSKTGVARYEELYLLDTPTAARQIDVYSLNGMLVRSVKLSAGEKVNLQLPNGVYVVGNRRIVVQ